jgi:hypothetical protein
MELKGLHEQIKSTYKVPEPVQLENWMWIITHVMLWEEEP